MSSKKEKKKNKDNEKTKQIKKVKDNKKSKDKKSKHPKLKLFIKIIAILILMVIIIGAGLIAGLIFGLFGEDFKITAEDLKIETMNTVLVDANGNEIAKLNDEGENREVALLSEMGEYLPKAFVAIEDKRFYEHNGVDIKRTFGATVKYVLGNSSYGGSTITQQLIKNATGDKEKHWTRKIKEIVRAYQIEREMSKDQILEAYLNTIPLGGGAKNVYGVKVAAKYYFDKAPSELTIEEAAYIAGINHAPNTYNPFKETPNMDKINTRTKTVLKEMYEQGKIDETQYNNAIQNVDNGLNFKEGVITNNNSLTQNEELAVKQVINEYAELKDLSYDVAEMKIKSGGYKIYITQNSSIQKILDNAYTNNSDWIKTKTVTRKNEDGTTYKETVQMQSAMVIIDQKTGYVVASRGVLGEKTAWGINRVVSEGHQPGSAIKPIAVITPALQEGVITAGTVLDDVPVTYGKYTPHNDDRNYNGLMNIRNVLRVSRNIPEVKMMKKLTPTKSIEYLKSFGITSIDDEKDAGLSLALGGVSNGISPLEMAAAYATIANGGVYIEPTFYTKVEDANGNVIMEKEQETHRVLSEQNAYIAQSLLTEPTGSGLTGTTGATGTGAKVTGMQTCGKTGTTDDSTTTWFCGFTPYYTASMYFGYDKQTDSYRSAPGSGTVARRWGNVMKQVHEGLASAKFSKPSGIVSATICQDSGLLAGDLCNQDQRGERAYSEIFAKGTVPSKTCNVHVKVKICKDTGKIANEYCTNTEEKVFITRENSSEDTSWEKAKDAQYMAPTETCDTHTKPQDTTKPVVTLKDGKATVTLNLKETFNDTGATAKDDVDGDITDKIKKEIKKDGKVVEKIDTSKVGTYTITYSVTDTAGNVGSVTRTVKIIEEKNTNTNTNTNTNSNTTNSTTNSITNNITNNTTTNTSKNTL